MKDFSNCILSISGESLAGLETPPAVGEELFMRIQDHVAKLTVSSSTMYMYTQISIVLNNKVLAMVGLISEPVNFVRILGNFGQTF